MLMLFKLFNSLKMLNCENLVIPVSNRKRKA